jgi:hypothetical protein
MWTSRETWRNLSLLSDLARFERHYTISARLSSDAGDVRVVDRRRIQSSCWQAPFVKGVELGL